MARRVNELFQQPQPAQNAPEPSEKKQAPSAGNAVPPITDPSKDIVVYIFGDTVEFGNMAVATSPQMAVDEARKCFMRLKQKGNWVVEDQKTALEMQAFLLNPKGESFFTKPVRMVRKGSAAGEVNNFGVSVFYNVKVE